MYVQFTSCVQGYNTIMHKHFLTATNLQGINVYEKLGTTHSQIVARIMTKRRVELSGCLFLYEAVENHEHVLVRTRMMK